MHADLSRSPLSGVTHSLLPSTYRVRLRALISSSMMRNKEAGETAFVTAPQGGACHGERMSLT